MSYGERLVVGFDIELREGKINHDRLADELERIAKMIREGYHEGELFAEDSDPRESGDSGYRGWWKTTEAT